MTVSMVPNLVSTIIPVFNRPQMLVEAVRSVLAQTYRPVELVVVDDGSTDETPGVIDRLVAAHPNEVGSLRITNGGPGLAREAGRQKARGEFIQYLDSDDLLLPVKFAIQVAALRKHPECGIAYGRTRLIDGSGNILEAPFKSTGKQLQTLFPGLLVDRWWNTHTPLYRRSICDAVGPWSAMSLSEDWEYEARVGALGVKLAFCDAYVAHTRRHDGMRLTQGPLGRSKILDSAKLNRTLFECAVAAGVLLDTPEMRHFARSAFLVARRAGAAGLTAESESAFELALSATEPHRRRRLALKLYQLVVGVLGWQITGKLAETFDRVTRRDPGPYTLIRPV